MYKQIIFTFNKLPKKIQISTYVYLSSIIITNFIFTYNNSKRHLLLFRDSKLKNKDFKVYDNKTRYINLIILNEYDAVIYGASEKFYMNLFESIIFPLALAKNLIPSIVLSLNKE